MNKDNALKYHCIKCNEMWGSGSDAESHGICPDCFAKWARSKSLCFGIETLVNKMHCSLYKYCKEHYGIR